MKSKIFLSKSELLFNLFNNVVSSFQKEHKNNQHQNWCWLPLPLCFVVVCLSAPEKALPIFCIKLVIILAPVLLVFSVFLLPLSHHPYHGSCTADFANYFFILRHTEQQYRQTHNLSLSFSPPYIFCSFQ